MKKILIVIAILLLPGLCFAQYDKRGGNVDGRAIAPSTITADNGTFERVVVTDGTNTIELDPANSGAALNADSATIETLTVDSATVNDTLTFAENAAIIGKVTITGTGEAPASIVLDPAAELGGGVTLSGPLTIEDGDGNTMVFTPTAGDGVTISDNLTVTGAVTATSFVATGGDGISKLTLLDNLADDNVDEYGVRFVNGVPYMRIGEDSIPISITGINADLAAMYRSQPNPITTVYGAVLDYPVVISSPVPDIYPYQPEIATADGRYVQGVAFKFNGVTDVTATGLYTESLFTSNEPVPFTPQINKDYLLATISSVTQTSEITRTLGSGINSIEFVAEIDVTGSTRTGGNARVLVGIDYFYLGVWYSIARGGFLSNHLVAGNNNHVAVHNNGATVTLASPAIAHGKVPVHIRIERTTENVNKLDYSVEINGQSVYAVEDYDFADDIADYPLRIVQSVSMASPVEAIDATATIKNYGWFISYAKD